MILVDTSVWIDYLRGTDHPAVETLATMIGRDEDLRITEPIVMELLSGLVRRENAAGVEALANGLPLLPIDPRLDFRHAAELAVASARNGHPIRSLVDCVIASVAIRNGAVLLHKDRDFDYLTEVSPLARA